MLLEGSPTISTEMNTTVMEPADRYTASAFGLTIDSAIELPELKRPPMDTDEESDVVIRRGTVEEIRPSSSSYITTDGTIHLHFATISIAIHDGRTIVVDHADDVAPEVIRHVILGPAINHLLHQRGLLVLHASTVAFDGSTVTFLGQSGQGKSTMALACLQAGHRVVSDDVAAIEFVDGTPMVHTGYPAIKLDEVVVERFDLPVGDPINPSYRIDRHFYRLPHEQPSDRLPLERVFLLTDDDKEAVEPLDVGERVVTLARNTYTTGLFGDPVERRRNFSQCGQLAEVVAVDRLHRRRRYDVLPVVVDLVQARCATQC